MEAKVLDWVQKTAFYQSNIEQLELIPQFPVGKYLKQLDPSYHHPAFRADFLLNLLWERRTNTSNHRVRWLCRTFREP